MVDELATKLVICKNGAAKRGLWRTFHAIDKATNILGEELDPKIYGKKKRMKC